MQYLVEMKLADSSRSRSPEEGLSFIEQYALPTLELCRKLQGEKKIVAGGPVSGAIALAMVMRAETIQELDELIVRVSLFGRAWKQP